MDKTRSNIHTHDWDLYNSVLHRYSHHLVLHWAFDFHTILVEEIDFVVDFEYHSYSFPTPHNMCVESLYSLVVQARTLRFSKYQTSSYHQRNEKY
jgi:hypothetical protein